MTQTIINYIREKKFVIMTITPLTVIGFSLFSFFDISFLSLNISNVEQTTIPLTDEQVADEQRWTEAQYALTNFYRNLNLHNFDEARECCLTEGYAKDNEAYSVEELSNWTYEKSGDTEILNIERDTGNSKDTTKVFSYETEYDMKDKQVCGEYLKAFVVLREGEWTIDTIHPNGYKDCK